MTDPQRAERRTRAHDAAERSGAWRAEAVARQVEAFNDELHINVYFMNVTNKQWYTSSPFNCCTLEPSSCTR